MFPPLGILYIAGALRNAGFRVQVLDGDPLVETDMIDRICAFEPDLVGISFLTMTWLRTVDLTRRLKSVRPQVPVMVGGPHATAEPEQTLEGLGVDIVVVGEGELTAVEIAKSLAAGDDLQAVHGILTRNGATPPRTPLADLNRLPLPARDLCDFERYLSPPGLIRGWSSTRHASVMAGRGCRYRCTFCASHLQLGRDLRMRSVDNVIAELDHLVDRYRIRGVYWVDDIFTGDKAWVRAFCQRLVQRPYQLEWGCQSRIESIDRSLLRQMKKAGCVQIDFGVESGAKSVLRRMKKGTTPSATLRAFTMVREEGLRSGASFILGSPGETAEDIAETITFSQHLAADWTVFFFSTPYPGTDLWRSLDHDRIETLPSYGTAWNNRQSSRPMCADSVSEEILVQARARAQNHHFWRNYMGPRNLPYAGHLLRVALSELPSIGPSIQEALRTRRLDGLVEACFAADRSRLTQRRAGPGHFGQKALSGSGRPLH